jgi:Domain of unknown function (DUF4266)
MTKKILRSVFFVLAGALSACQVVKPYQRVYLNDHEMRPGQRTSAKHERNALSYREGASGGGSGKVSGGCGCN